MHLTAFVHLFPEQGTKQTRMITLRGNSDVPDDEYSLLKYSSFWIWTTLSALWRSLFSPWVTKRGSGDQGDVEIRGTVKEYLLISRYLLIPLITPATGANATATATSAARPGRCAPPRRSRPSTRSGARR
jgi:hypothetical protein